MFVRIGGGAYGVARRVIRDPAQAEECTPGVLLEVWRRAAGFDPVRGTADQHCLGCWLRKAQVRSLAASTPLTMSRAASWSFWLWLRE